MAGINKHLHENRIHHRRSIERQQRQSTAHCIKSRSRTTTTTTPHITSCTTCFCRQIRFSMLNFMRYCHIFAIIRLIGVIMPSHVLCVDPKFDPSTRMRLVLVPTDAQIGSVIYRLRATDEEFDYPLTFELAADTTTSTVKIESLPCTKYNSVCQANVLLQHRLEPGRYYDFQVSVKDTKGGMATQLCSITATNYTTPIDLIFPHKPGIMLIPEDAKRGTELDYVLARKNPLFQKPVYLELWGSPLFAIRQKIISPDTTEGTIFLLGPLDFEKQAMYHLTILANDAYAEPGQDSRNIAGMEIVVIVQDVQDQPPVFTLAPPVTKLPFGILPGDKILKVHAEDGDKGNPREIRYGLVSEANPFTSFFDINETSGEIFLMRPLEDIAAIKHIGDPVLLTVIAEEVKVGRDEPPDMASTVQLAFLLPERTNSPPYFENDHYITRIDENAPQGTALVFADPYVTRVYDDDSGKNGIFSLTLLNNNGTFEISPNVAERSASFLIRVRDNLLLDYEERHSVQFQIFAQEIGPATNLSAIVNVTIYITDVNDNAPVFSQSVYTVELPENMTMGTEIVHVHADDIDTNLGGKVRYTAVYGYLNTSINLDAETGVITVSTNNHGFDREVMPEYHFYVEARDNDGTGNRAQVPLVMKLIDVNDETPIFEKELYEFILSTELTGFTSTAIIHAEDKDATAPNNEVRYEIINGNYENKFVLDEVSGVLSINEKLNLHSEKNKRQTSSRQSTSSSNASDFNNSALIHMFILTARAYDLGVPVRSSTTTIRIYPPESRKRTVTFVVPGINPEKAKTEETLSAITGGKVVIHEIRPLQPSEQTPQVLPNNMPSISNRSVVTASVFYDKSSVVDISEIQKRLSNHNSSYAIMARDSEEIDELYKSENKLLFWLLILLATLVALTVLLLLLCCICPWCPLYGARSERIVNISKTQGDLHLVHREMANGKQTKSVQVADWMGSREAWSAGKPSDSHTKPTRWEFHDGRDQHEENINTEDDQRRIHSLEERHRRAIIKNNRTTEDEFNPSFHNSRTNLINNRDVYIEDVIDDRKVFDGNTDRLYRSKTNRHGAQRKNYDMSNHQNKNSDDDSLKRHEIDRGSDIEYDTARSSLKQKREFFIKDGNIEILQLMTRDKSRNTNANAQSEKNIYMNVPLKSNNPSQPQLLLVENSGKEILMRRFIEEQPDGNQIIREHYQILPESTNIHTLPNEIQQNPVNSIVYTQTEPEVKVIHTQPAQGPFNLQTDHLNTQMQPAISNQSLTNELENSFKQQNALLQKLLLDREMLEKKSVQQQENVLETQSLPGQSMMEIATQTDCEAGTQTDADFGFPYRNSTKTKDIKRKRKARSENDDSLSETEYEYVRFSPPNSPNDVYWIKRRRQKRRPKYCGACPRRHFLMVEDVKRKIRTPIKEEDGGSDNDIMRQKSSPPRKPVRRSTNSKANTPDTSRHQSETFHRDFFVDVDDKTSPEENRKRKIRVEHLEYYDDSETDEESNDDKYSISDGDDVVLKSKYFGNSSTEDRLSRDDGSEREIHKIRLKTRDNVNGSLHSQGSSMNELSENKMNTKTSKVRLSRKDRLSGSTNSTKQVRMQTASEPPNSRKPISRQHSDEKGTRAAPSNRKSNVKSKDRAYQSDIDHREREDATTAAALRNVPKYMEWYYRKKKVPESNSNHSRQRKSTVIETTHSEQGISRTSVNIKSGEITAPEEHENKYKPEPAPRKSPPRSSRILAEEKATNKKHDSTFQPDTNHPLLQHSEHRFERENVLEVPVPATKLPHYMYPETPPFATAEQGKDKAYQKPKPSPIKENEVKVSNSNLHSLKSNAAASSMSSPSVQKLNVSTLEDDHDSGIAMNSLLNSMGRRNPIAEKKSIFAIAYDDVSRVKNITSEADSPQ